MRFRHSVVSVTVIGLLIIAAAHVDWRAAAVVLRKASALPLLAAVVTNLVSLSLHGVRWWIFLRRVGPVPLSLAVRGSAVGAGLNNLLVASGGDAARALLVARESGLPRTRILATLVLDRFFDPLCFGVLLFVATFMVPLPPALEGARWITGLALLGAAAVLVLLARASPRELAGTHATSRWRGYAGAFRVAVTQISTTRRFVSAIAVSLCIWLLQIVTFALAARSAGLRLPLAAHLAALLSTNAGLVLRATPGNVGYFQLAYAIATRHFGAATDAAVATALLIQLVQIVPVTAAALVLAPRMMRATPII